MGALRCKPRLAGLAAPSFRGDGQAAHAAIRIVDHRVSTREPRHGLKDASEDPQQIRALWRDGQTPILESPRALLPASLFSISILAMAAMRAMRSFEKKCRAHLANSSKCEAAQTELTSTFSILAAMYPAAPTFDLGIHVKGGRRLRRRTAFSPCERRRYGFVSHNGFVVPVLAPALRDLIVPQHKHSPRREGLKSHSIAFALVTIIKALIREGKPKGQRSEALFAALRAMIKGGHTNTEITAVLTDPANKLSEKPRELGKAWLEAEILRARVEARSRAYTRALVATTGPRHFGLSTGLTDRTRANKLALASARRARKGHPHRGTAGFREVADHDTYSGDNVEWLRLANRRVMRRR